MIFQEQCAGVVMLCNYYEDGMQKCDEFFPTENGGYKYYGKMFVNNKKVWFVAFSLLRGLRSIICARSLVRSCSSRTKPHIHHKGRQIFFRFTKNDDYLWWKRGNALDLPSWGTKENLDQHSKAFMKTVRKSSSCSGSTDKSKDLRAYARKSLKYQSYEAAS
ncbi:unnamed protein product [Angiostrongylus costaricensis]|uniref:Tyrosine-protein phosphatase domain-containing protein n=1 Tax=Angiostrongylus costaricensis TaxID=334426 RepID=A0A0R3PA72_ANGCS|nr:unnamed protein product [Angiostrongylus costaricensis]